jgi:hypothetical protein
VLFLVKKEAGVPWLQLREMYIRPFSDEPGYVSCSISHMPDKETYDANRRAGQLGEYGSPGPYITLYVRPFSDEPGYIVHHIIHAILQNIIYSAVIRRAGVCCMT